MRRVLNYLLSPFTDLDKKASSDGRSLYELDGLRGIAVLIVLMSHTSAFGMYGQGSLGVILFFFLSGYVLSLPFVENPRRVASTNEVARYFVNRALRIVPAYWFFCIAIYLWTSSSLEWLLWNLSFVKGWNHFWSVAQEVRFYLLFPLVIAAISMVRFRALRLVILALLILFFYELKGFHKIDMMTGKKTEFYFWMFLGGVLTCFVSKEPRLETVFSRPLPRTTLALCGLVVLIGLFTSSTFVIESFWRDLFPAIPKGFKLNGWSNPGLWFFLFSTLFLAISWTRNSWLSKFLNLKILRHFGLLSYSVYIIHMTIQYELMSRGYQGERLFVSVLLISYVLAYFSYVLIEKPCLKFKGSTLFWFNKPRAFGQGV